MKCLWLILVVGAVAHANSFEEENIGQLPEPMRSKVLTASKVAANQRAFWSFYLVAVCQPLTDEGSKTVALEKEKASVAGLVNRGVLYEAQEKVVAGRKCTAQAAAVLKERRLTALAGTRPEVRDVKTCLENPESTEPRCVLWRLLSADSPTREAWFAEMHQPPPENQ